MKYIIGVLGLAAVILGYNIYFNVFSDDIKFDMAHLTILKQDGSKVELKAKIADTINERAKGLMDVKSLGDDEGMIFVFEAEEMRKMWMENTYIPLDMIFVNKKKEIFNYHENAQPLSRNIIYSVGPALYVIEVNGGFIKKNNITPGDKIEYSK